MAQDLNCQECTALAGAAVLRWWQALRHGTPSSRPVPPLLTRSGQQKRGWPTRGASILSAIPARCLCPQGHPSPWGAWDCW